LIVAAKETLPPGTQLAEFAKTFGKSWGDLDRHAAGCLSECAQLFRDQRSTERPGKPKFIYSEGAEELGALEAFQRDIELSCEAVVVVAARLGLARVVWAPALSSVSALTRRGRSVIQ